MLLVLGNVDYDGFFLFLIFLAISDLVDANATRFLLLVERRDASTRRVRSYVRASTSTNTSHHASIALKRGRTPYVLYIRVCIYISSSRFY